MSDIEAEEERPPREVPVVSSDYDMCTTESYDSPQESSSDTGACALPKREYPPDYQNKWWDFPYPAYSSDDTDDDDDDADYDASVNESRSTLPSWLGVSVARPRR